MDSFIAYGSEIQVNYSIQLKKIKNKNNNKIFPGLQEKLATLDLTGGRIGSNMAPSSGIFKGNCDSIQFSPLVWT